MLAENPPRLGINWVSSLEVAYRAVAWRWLLWILHRLPGRTRLDDHLPIVLDESPELPENTLGIIKVLIMTTLQQRAGFGALREGVGAEIPPYELRNSD